jgi:hypothetical protein
VLEELARELGVSPVPVREVVRRLEAEGYVDFQRNVGARVASFDERQFEQTLHVVAWSAPTLNAPARRLAEPGVQHRGSFHLAYTQSKDDGRDWSRPARIDKTPVGSAAAPAVAVSPTGRQMATDRPGVRTLRS